MGGGGAVEDAEGGLGLSVCVHRGECLEQAARCVSPHLRSPSSGFWPPSLCHRILPFHLQGGRTQHPGRAQCPGARRPETKTSLSGLLRLRGPGWCAWVPGSPSWHWPQLWCASWHWPQPRCAQRPRRPPAQGTDQAACECERRDSCSGLKYAGYFYLPTSGGQGHPTSGLGGCYTMFPFSREGKWREARLPDHMVLKSMKKN